MKKQLLLGVTLALTLMACTQKIYYPMTPKSDHTDTYFGTPITDHYRWLEDDQSAQTKKWISDEQAITNSYLSQIPFRDSIKNRMTAVWDYPSTSAPMKRGKNYFVFRNNGQQNQAVLYILKSPKDTGEVLLDPNTFSTDGTVSLSEMSFSKDGRYLAYSISISGSDWREVFVLDVANRTQLSDHLKWAKFTTLTWLNDGFFYSKYPEPLQGQALKGANINSSICYHQLGEDQTKDQVIYKDATHPEWGFSTSLSSDDNYLFISVTQSTNGNALYVLNTKQLQAKPQVLVSSFDHNYEVVDVIQGKALIRTDDGAPNYHVISIDLNKADAKYWKTIIPEQKESLAEVHYFGGVLLASYLKDVHSLVVKYSITGDNYGTFESTNYSIFSGFSGTKDDSIVYFVGSSYLVPSQIYEYNTNTSSENLFIRPSIDFNSEDYQTKQVFYTSKDGTKIPMFIVAKKGIKLDGTNPTLLYGYGGFGISITPAFTPRIIPWLEAGGVYAVANLRGGGEYGESWHQAGTKMNKQNVFDDCIAAAEYLISTGYTSKEYLALQGRSNGGLLVAATVNKRPDLFRVAIPMVGVMDMLRYQQFTIGRYWSADYGTSEDSKEMFEYLKNYSPLLNIKPKVEYPSILVTTSDHDDRVVPAHSFKYAATLQNTYTGNRPMLIRIAHKAGHGPGLSKTMEIEEYSDIWAFILYNMGYKYPTK